MALLREDLWGFVSGTEVQPNATDPGYHKFCTRRDRALAVIVMSIETKLLYIVGDPVDPEDVWKKLEDVFQRKTWANKMRLRKRLYKMQLEENTSVHEHLKQFIELFSDLAVLGNAIDDDDKVIHLLSSLPESYNTLVTAIEAQEKVPTWEAVAEKLLHEEQKQKETQSSEVKPAAMVSKSSNRNFKCYECGKPGHIRKNCRQYLKNLNTSQQANVNEVETAKSADYESCGLTSVNCAQSADATGEWIIDSGASRHMCNKKECFVKLLKLKTKINVKLGDGRIVHAVAIGNVELKVNLHDKMNVLRLKNVLFVPSLSHSLLSIPDYSNVGKTVFLEDLCEIFNACNTLEARGRKINGLYYLCLFSETSVNAAHTESQSELWHKRFCHLHEQGLKKLSREKLVSGIDVNDDLSFCESCVFGKQCRVPFPKKSVKRAEAPLEIVHSDVCGKVSSPSFSGCQYFLTFIDDYTHYVWVYVLKTKDQVFDKFKEFKSCVENQTGFKIKCLRSDNGGEYTSLQFEQFLTSAGIIHEKTCAKTPQQNGVAERMNRSLVETVRTMLHDAQLPKVFWAEALSTAVYIRNVSPTSALLSKTPSEALTGRKPIVNHLRVFGCIAYAHIPKDERQKFDVKSVKCIMLGYCSNVKGYRLYDLSKKRVFLSRDVTFNEGERSQSEKELQSQEPVELIENQVIETRVELPCDDDHEPAAGCGPLGAGANRIRRAPDRYGDWVYVTHESDDDPKTFHEAQACRDSHLWHQAMESEMLSMNKNCVWDLVEPVEGCNVLKCKWVFKKKLGSDGKVVRHKARLVAKGFDQKYSIDYNETFSPVTKFESVRTLLATAAQRDLHVHHMDVSTAFLNGDLSEDVYMMQPQGFVEKGKENLVCKLNKSIYGLKQAPRCWNSELDSFLKSMHFVQSKSDPCIYVKNGENFFVISVYVDDIILACKSIDEIESVKNQLKSKYQMTDFGSLKYFLGVHVKQDPSNGSIFISQGAYTERVLQKFGLADANSVKSPVDVSAKWQSDTPADPVLYKSAIGSLIYLATKTRPDIAFVVNKLARYCSAPTQDHMSAVKRVMRYLKGTANYGLLYLKNEHGECHGFADADWAGDSKDRKSTSGFSFQLSGASISWSSSKQSCVALSTAEAEYVALSGATQEAAWLKNLLGDLNYNVEGPMTIFEDNTAAICIANDALCNRKTKHIDLKFHYIRDQISCNKIQLRHCRSEDMIADVLTKGVTHEKFVRMRKLLGVVSEPPSMCEKEC